MTKSILDSTAIQEILTIAKKNLERDGKLCPVLFFHLRTGERLITPLHLPATSEDRQRYITGLGFSLLREGKMLEEAVMLLESWFVAVKGNSDALTIAPSQHPQRKEAIILIGRDATKSRSIIVIQPFTRSPKGEPIWEKMEGNMSDDAPKANEPSYEGLLDFLFVRERGKTGSLN